MCDFSGGSRDVPSPPGGDISGSGVEASSRTRRGQEGRTWRKAAKPERASRLSSVDSLAVVPYRVAPSSGRTFQGSGRSLPRQQKGRPKVALVGGRGQQDVDFSPTSPTSGRQHGTRPPLPGGSRGPRTTPRRLS